MVDGKGERTLFNTLVWLGAKDVLVTEDA